MRLRVLRTKIEKLLSQKPMDEDAKTLFEFYELVGIEDEMELLKKVKEVIEEDERIDVDIDKDLRQLERMSKLFEKKEE